MKGKTMTPKILSIGPGTHISLSWRVRMAALALMGLLLIVPNTNSHSNQAPDQQQWKQKLASIVWVGYSPPSSDPTRQIEASPVAIRADLNVLRKAGFTGLVTYSSSGVLGRELPAIAQELGYEGIIMGIWNPSNTTEITAAKAVGNSPLVIGYCVGNEGLGSRYQRSTLANAIQDIRKATGKPVTTTETIEHYQNDDLLQLGDWAFPNVHPYFNNQIDPDRAVFWTQGAYDDLKRRTNKPIIFKEVGLPTSGGPQLSESAQQQYYFQLAKTNVPFVYFEAFDQPWKTHLVVEPHWGIFRADRTPKQLGQSLLEQGSRLQTAAAQSLYIYQDADSSANHYSPSGYMGDIGDISMNDAFKVNPHSGKTCIRISYEAKGTGPNKCPYSPPCKWAGVYWQEPPNNWGVEEAQKGKGLDLSGYKRLVFWARAESNCTIEFKVGGINESYGDSLSYPRTTRADLDQTWRQFEIDLKGANLKHIIGGFCWVSNWGTNPKGATFYLDDIQFEK
jgi:exo-beta-1,3-glucanase (GH17 family)